MPSVVVCNVKVISDKVADVSSIEEWAKNYLKPGMSDKDKALAVWRSVVAHQHQNAPPAEYLQSPENGLTDPLKMFNVYGYGLCSVHASHVIALARAAGLTARGKTIQRHCVAEVFWDGQWHMLDASLVNYFPNPDGTIASVDEIVAAVAEFYKGHPDLKDNPEGLAKFCKDPGWQHGPKLLADCPFYGKDGLFPANWPWQCGWPESMREYDCTGKLPFIYESGYTMGYRVNIQLRPGERLTRNWFNKGLHLEMYGGKTPTCLTAQVGESSMAYCRQYGDLAPGRIGNGVLEYNVPLASGAFRAGALTAENLAATAENGVREGEAPAEPTARGLPVVHVLDPARPGVLVLRMPSSYVYLTGALEMAAVVGQGGRIAVSFSENNGLDWKEIATVNSSGGQKIDLSPLVFRRYDYRLKFEMTGAGTGLDSLTLRHDIQHSQRPLPALAQGDNTITFSADPSISLGTAPGTPEGTITIEGSTLAANRGKQVLYTDFHPQQENIGEPMISVKGSGGCVTFPVRTPGAIQRVRIFAFYRARAPGDHWDVGVSFDGGKTFKNAGRLDGPVKAMGKQFTVEAPNSVRAGSDSGGDSGGDWSTVGTTEALVRFCGTQTDAAMLFNVRIDADYAEPHGGFRPVKITYLWDEDGKPCQDVHVARNAGETYVIRCASKPTMKSIILELAE